MAKVEIKVKTLDSRVLTLEINGGTTINQMKQMICSLTQVPVEQQRLIFLGKVLKDTMTISEYPGLMDGGSTVHMIQRQSAPDSGASGCSLISLVLAPPHLRHGQGWLQGNLPDVRHCSKCLKCPRCREFLLNICRSICWCRKFDIV